MAKQFIQTSTGLVEVDTQKIKNYQSKECVEAAIASGELKEGELFSTNVHIGIDEDIVDKVHNIELLIPESASAQNVLVTVCQLLSCINDLDIGNLRTQVDTNTCDIACRVTCSDYTTKMATVDTAITTNADGINALTCNLSSFITNVYTPLECYACNCLVQCSWISDVYTPQATAWTNNINDLGTSLNTLSGKVANLSNCSGLDCIGNVTDTQMNDALACKVECTDYATCIACLVARICALESCPGLNCTGTVTSSNFTLTGTTLDMNI